VTPGARPHARLGSVVAALQVSLSTMRRRSLPPRSFP
jgi:hypothetical protein